MTQRHKIASGHGANIFDVKWIPAMNNRMLVHGGVDCEVRLSKIYEGCTSTEHWHTFNNRVKKIDVHPNDPFVFLVASEEGVVQMWDVREKSTQGFPVVDHRDLTSSGQRSREELGSMCKAVRFHPYNHHIFAAGFNVPTVRLYDRRMATSSSRLAEEIESFCPRHLQCRKCMPTDLCFSEDAHELLVMYNGDHAYSFEVSSSDKYKVSKKFTWPAQNHVEPHPTEVAKAHKLYQRANQLVEADAYPDAVVYYTDALQHQREPRILANRSMALAKRDWVGDKWMAFYDAEECIRISPNQTMGYLRKIRVLQQMQEMNLALEFARYASTLFPNGELASVVKDLENGIKQAAATRPLDNDDEPGPLTRLLRRRRRKRKRDSSPEASAQESPQKKMATENADGSPSASPAMKPLPLEQAPNMDLEEEKTAPPNPCPAEPRGFLRRYVGHSNLNTDIKSACILGKMVILGGDDGAFHVYDRISARLLNVVENADDDIVNIVAPHPNGGMLAISGIDSSIKLYSPTNDDGEYLTSLDCDAIRMAQYNLKRSRATEGVLGSHRTSGGIAFLLRLLSSSSNFRHVLDSSPRSDGSDDEQMSIANAVWRTSPPLNIMTAFEPVSRTSTRETWSSSDVPTTPESSTSRILPSTPRIPPEEESLMMPTANQVERSEAANG